MRSIFIRPTAWILLGLCLSIDGDRLSAEGPLPPVEDRGGKPSVTESLPWRPAAPRAEIAPEFSFDPKGGPRHDGALAISADERRGLHGCWQRTFEVKGGEFYRFV